MSHTGDGLIKLGQRVSFVYFTEDIPLETSVAKIASEESLNPEQIKRVCEVANKETMIQIYKSANDQTQEFDLADHKKVIDKVSAYEKPEEPVSMDYYRNPPSCITSTVKIASDFFSGEKDYERTDRKNALIKQASVLEIELKDVQGSQIMGTLKLANLKGKLADVMKAALQSGHSVQDLMAAAMKALPGEGSAVKKLFSDVLEKIKKSPGVSSGGFLSNVWSGIKGLFKGAEAVDEALISKALQAANGLVPLKVINGDDQFFGALKMVYDQAKEVKLRKATSHNLRDKIKVVRTELSALTA